MDQAGRWAPHVLRHQEGVQHQIGVQSVVHRQSDDPPMERVDDDADWHTDGYIWRAQRLTQRFRCERPGRSTSSKGGREQDRARGAEVRVRIQ